MEEGDKYYKEATALLKEAVKGDYDSYSKATGLLINALEFYKKANNFNSDNALLNYKIGVCFIFSNFKSNATHFLEKAFALNPAIDPMIHYYLGRTYHLGMQWEKAIEEYKTYMQGLNVKENKEQIADVNRKINECINGEEYVKHPARVFIDNVGAAINSKYPDYAPVISADESVMIFTSRRDNTTGGGMDEDINQYFEDIYISTKKDKNWGPALNIGKPINTPGHDATMALSADGQKLFVYIDDNNNGDIYECNLKGDIWSKPEHLNDNINTKYHESSASLSSDGKTLYFVSDKSGGVGYRDIYYSTLSEKGKWQQAQNIGPVINTQYGEEGVFIHPDGKTMYFSSQGHKSMGGYDIFKSVFENGKWSEPENLGYPINTPDDDVFFVISASGKHGYYASFKNDGLGEKDIYMVTFLGPEKPMVLNNEDNLIASQTEPVKETVIAKAVEVTKQKVSIFKGLVRDAKTQKPVEADIDLVNLTDNKEVASFKSNSKTGRFLLSLPAGKNYGIAVKADGYLFHSENFNFPDTADYMEVNKIIDLQSIEVGQVIVLRNIFFDFDKATLRPESINELERLTKLLQDNPSIVIEISGHTDNKGSAEYNQKLSEARSKSVVDYLISKGINKGRLQYKGYGLAKPMATNDTEEGRQLNRRTEFKILSK